MRIALALERYHTAAHGDVDRTPMMRWSDSSPLVNDLMAAGIRLCSYMIGVDPERSQTLIVPLRSMVACTMHAQIGARKHSAQTV